MTTTTIKDLKIGQEFRTLGTLNTYKLLSVLKETDTKIQLNLENIKTKKVIKTTRYKSDGVLIKS